MFNKNNVHSRAKKRNFVSEEDKHNLKVIALTLGTTGATLAYMAACYKLGQALKK